MPRAGSLPFSFVDLEDIPAPEGTDVPWQEFHRVRNAILEALGELGTIGPMGPAPITDDEEPPPPWDWEGPDCPDTPDFFVVADHVYEGRFQRVEIEGSLPADAVDALLAVAERHAGWGIGVAFADQRYLYIRADGLWAAAAAARPTSLTDFIQSG